MNANVIDATTESTTRPSTKEIVLALAKPVAYVGVGVALGMLVEKMKNRSNDTTEA